MVYIGGRDVEEVEFIEANDDDRAAEWVPVDSPPWIP